MKIRILLTIMALLPLLASAQSGGVTGKVVTRQGRNPISDVEVTLGPGHTTKVYTDAAGNFSLGNIPAGTYDVRISSPDWQPVDLRIVVGSDMKDMGMISLTSGFTDIAIDDFEEAEIDFESGDVQSMSSSLSASGDIFNDAAGFRFSSMRFRTRGYDQSMGGVYLNGIYFNDALTGYSPWSLWSGLNDATRSQEKTIGAAVSDYGVGGINGTTNILARASQVRKGFRASVVNASGQYRFRVMVTYGSGELDNGWSYALSASTRQGGNDWVNGVYYNSWAYFGSVEKKFNDRHRLAFTFFGTPGERAVQGASTQEVYDLVGSNYYNPNWGYQGDSHHKSDMRSARIRNTHEPVAMLNYFFTPNDKTQLLAAFSYRFGKNGYSALEWGDANDPRPDYYRNLPSYYEQKGDEDGANSAREGWLTSWNYRQINWNKLYNTNRNNPFKSGDYYDGITPEGMRKSETIVEDRRTDQNDFNAKLQISTQLDTRSKLTMGYNIRVNRTEYYKRVKDLLGGDYFLDVNKFAEQSYGNEDKNQNDLSRPNRLVKKGDKFGYDYYAHHQSHQVWGVYRFTFPQGDIVVAAEAGNTRFWREGRVENGLFRNQKNKESILEPGGVVTYASSLGNSQKLNFWTYTAKVGASYRIDGAHTLSANFARIQQAPYFQNTFLSPRTRNSVAMNVTTEKITSVDLNYTVTLPAVRARLTGFYTQIRDRMDLISYYDDVERTFSNFSMTGIGQQHTGVELGVSVPLSQSFTAEGVLNYGYYRYDNNPYMTMTADNDNRIMVDNEQVYWKGSKVEGTPQTAISIALNYRGPNSIFAGVDLNYFDAMYLSMSPLYRTDRALENMTESQIKALTDQEMFNEKFVLNANVGKMWRLRGGYTLGMNLQVRNILNNKTIKTGGWEQMRLIKEDNEGDTKTYGSFGSKYYYMFGTTYYLQFYLRF